MSVRTTWIHVSRELTGLISTRFKLCADVRELDGSYNDGTVPVSAAVINRVRAYKHYSYREQGYNPESLDGVVHTPENDAGKGDEGAISEDVEGSNCVVQHSLENNEDLQSFWDWGLAHLVHAFSAAGPRPRQRALECQRHHGRERPRENDAQQDPTPQHGALVRHHTLEEV